MSLMVSARETVSHIVLSETRVLVLLRGNKEEKGSNIYCVSTYLILEILAESLNSLSLRFPFCKM